ncbi:hypothetical protein BC832DRAFT_541210 [Gaertneriomyces semiglobifer]|nr:hypothetical protein BC832DRAFT_541210 [Gaertneriomyces semiglobifer]
MLHFLSLQPPDPDPSKHRVRLRKLKGGDRDDAMPSGPRNPQKFNPAGTFPTSRSRRSFGKLLSPSVSLVWEFCTGKALNRRIRNEEIGAPVVKNTSRCGRSNAFLRTHTHGQHAQSEERTDLAVKKRSDVGLDVDGAAVQRRAGAAPSPTHTHTSSTKRPMAEGRAPTCTI